MKYFVLLFMMFLIGAWAYTSWYWYTCNIKWFCEETAYVVQDASPQEIDSLISNTSSPVVVANDVVVETVEQPDDTSWETSPEVEDEEIQNGTPPEETNTPEPETESTECTPIITQPIQFWAENNTGEVESLEIFLNTQWANLPIDWEYGSADEQAVKDFQKQYRAEILDPWGISEPTGYVYKTTIEKINEIACQ